ncbi:MAG: (2Fe-2S)-binding protein [Deltaproteobacteria bacterium]|nr:(2Fe-2S)-binding protein [Deltaproteobacteria bacterium]
MIVCLCKGVSCGNIRNAVAQGATTVAEVGYHCGAGTDCGGCHGTIEDLIEEELEATAASATGHRSLPVVRAA